jgi:hypothetical protein
MNQSVNNIFGRINDDGNVAILYADDGSAVTQLTDGEHPLLWPVDSDVSAYYEHPNGIILTREDADKLGIEIE